MPKMTGNEISTYVRFVSVALELAYAETPDKVSLLAMEAYTLFCKDKPMIIPMDNKPINDFLQLPDAEKIAFVEALGNAIDEIVVPVLNNKLRITSTREFWFSPRGAEILDVDIFQKRKIEIQGGKTAFEVKYGKEPGNTVPAMALELMAIIPSLPNGLKTCLECERHFFNTRKNVKFCGEHCRYRHHYHKKIQKQIKDEKKRMRR
jgi:hypothetical protein